MDRAVKPLAWRQWKSGHWETVDSGAIVEQPVSLMVNGEEWLTFLCTPVDLEALAVGFLYNEHILNSLEEVASLRVCPERDNVDVWLHKSAVKPKNWRRTSGCTGGFTNAMFPLSGNTHRNGISLTPEVVGELIASLLDSQELYRQVGGVHSSALSDGKTILMTADDIGRHNTLDKIAGRCLMEPVPDGPRLLLSTGRISSDMLQKAARIGAAVVISRTAASSLAIEMAQQAGITLIGYARRDRFTLYTHPDRIRSGSERVPTSKKR